MDLRKLYSDIYRNGIDAVKSGGESVDNHIGDSSDTRMGIALVIRPPEEVRDNIACVLNQIRDVERGQYYYPKSDFHITLLEIIRARQDFRYTGLQLSSCRKVAAEAVKLSEPFVISFDGIIISDGAVMVKGFCGGEMEKLREDIRKSIILSGLPPDERYKTVSCHMTVGRFCRPLVNRGEFLDVIESFNRHEFGSFEVSEIELVNHDWYDSRKELLGAYRL